MADPHHHAISSAKKWGGVPEDYIHIHMWLDSTKAHFADFRHRAILHNSWGIALCVQIHGQTLTLSTGTTIPVRWVAEQHVVEDLGRIPSLQDWLQCIAPKQWMGTPQKLNIAEVTDHPTPILPPS